MKIFITGGAGFIGSHLVQRFLLPGAENKVVVFDNLSSGQKEFLQEFLLDPRLSFIEGELHDVNLVQRSLSGCDIVVHLAANPDISKAEIDPSLDFRQGTLLTQNILEAMRLESVPAIIFTSGSGVYGDLPGKVFSEQHGPCLPVSPYGAAKLGSEALISAYCHMFNIKGRALRFANVVGPNQTHGVGFDFIKKLRRNRSALHILGDGKQCKSYIHIADVLNAIDVVIRDLATSKLFDVFNVATDDYVTVEQIAREACTAFRVEPDYVQFTYSGGARGWNGDVPQVRFDSSKIRSLGWSNAYSSSEAIRRSLSELVKRLTAE